MKITSVGGGPAGLYFGILMKKLDPSHEVVVYERNPADATFGFGVVFSEDTLSHFGAADPESYKAITDAFVHWTDINVHDDRGTMRSTGHGFVGISRRRFLNILQARASELGVTIHYEQDLDSERIEQLKAESDLLLAADGVRSATRDKWINAFRPRIEPGKARYIWLGTSKRFDAFTFIFRESEFGLFQVHAYPFDDTQSTFIVEMPESTWQKTGFADRPIEESIAYCERLFAKELEGHSLISNNSRWLQFSLVTNARWYSENVVIVGDAAHTAHFSIGSGTKLAMEDSIALADVFRRKPTVSVREALVLYEAERRPEVERIQRAALRSQTWFESTTRHHKQRLPTFVFSLMTRSQRIGFTNLGSRDRELASTVERDYLSNQGIEVMPEAPRRTPMFTPFKVGGIELDNRVVVAPMCMYSAQDGLVGDWHLVHLGSRALGGAGLIMAEMTAVSPDARITPRCAGLYKDEHQVAWKRVVDFVHAQGKTKIGIQLGHAGRKGASETPWVRGYDAPLWEGAWPLVAPSPIPYMDGMQVPSELTRAQMLETIKNFERAAERARDAGFDTVELHAAHGYLLSTFLSPVSNQRTDEFGGSLTNRMRFPLEVTDAIRALWPRERAFSVRISATDWVEGGFSIDDAVALARELKLRGVDYISVSSGGNSSEQRPVYGRLYQVALCEQIRNEAGIPTLAAGAIERADEVNTILAAGRADLVALARQHLRDPYFTLHAAADVGYPVDWPSQYLEARPRPGVDPRASLIPPRKPTVPPTP